MIRYKLSPQVELTHISEYGAENIPEKFQADHFVLYHSIKNREYLINPSVKYFLDKFSTPNSLGQVVDMVKQELNTTNDEVEMVCKEFFDFLVSRKIIVEEHAAQAIVESNILFNEGDIFNGLIIQNLISNRKQVVLYKVVDTSSNMESVLKILLRSKTKNDKEFSYETGWLEREYALLNRMSHIPAMCKGYSFDKNESLAYIQLEYIKGKSLNSFLDNVEGFELEVALTFLSRMIAPFAAMHQSDLIHGDIHSSNILVKENMEVKIIDLGFSSLAELEKDQLMKSGGVTFYMPPERINLTSVKKYKSSAANLRSDVYQVGLLMFLTVYKILPFSGFIWEELATNIQTEAIEFAAVSFSGFPVPENLISIMKKCLERNPVHRYANASFILRDFNYHFYPQNEPVIN